MPQEVRYRETQESRQTIGDSPLNNHIPEANPKTLAHKIHILTTFSYSRAFNEY